MICQECQAGNQVCTAYAKTGGLRDSPPSPAANLVGKKKNDGERKYEFIIYCLLTLLYVNLLFYSIHA